MNCSVGGGAKNARPYETGSIVLQEILDGAKVIHPLIRKVQLTLELLLLLDTKILEMNHSIVLLSPSTKPTKL